MSDAAICRRGNEKGGAPLPFKAAIVFAMCACIALAMAMGADPPRAWAATATVESTGQHYYDGSDHTQGMTINGMLATCLNHWDSAPVGLTVTSVGTVTNDKIRKALFYGDGGPGDDGSWSRVQTSVACSMANGDHGSGFGNAHAEAFYNALGNYSSPPDSFVVTKWSAGGGWQTLATWVYNPKGSMELTKKSKNSSVSDNNNCYSLSGAVYGVYGSVADANTHAKASALKTYQTDSDGKWATGKEWDPGTYYVAEITAPKGFALDGNVYPITVKPDGHSIVNESQGYVEDIPQHGVIDMWATKIDADTADGSPQGSGSLAGAEFTIKYYDGSYDLTNLPSTAKRTWVVRTDSSGHATVADGAKVSGKDYYRTTAGKVIIPLGTVTVTETKAPSGYTLGKPKTHLFTIVPTGTSMRTVTAYVAPTVADHIIRGGVKAGKADRQNGTLLAQGAASLAGAEFEITTENESPVVVEGVTYARGSVVKTIAASSQDDGRAIAATGADCLPAGTYTIRETKAAEGYLFDDASKGWSRQFTISENGQMADLTNPAETVSNQVIRGDFNFSKADAKTMKRMGRVPFMLKSKTTGEWHVLVTDENGLLSTAADWNPHTHACNANDGAVSTKKGKVVVDEGKLDPKAGIWFSGRADASCAPDDAMGALPFDTYTIEELPAAANEGYDPVNLEVTISKDTRKLDLGTVNNQKDVTPPPAISTSLSSGHGIRLVEAASLVGLTDTVNYANLDSGSSYTMRGTLLSVNEDGSVGTAVAEGSTPFTPRATNGAVDVEFAIDTSQMANARLVAFEELVDAQGATIAEHEEPLYEGQTIRVPSIGTSLVDANDGDHVANPMETVDLVDTVSYSGLVPGKTYTVTGTLHVRNEDGSDGGALADAAGNPITARQSFTAATSEGTVDVPFSFASPELPGKTVVAFEELQHGSATFAVHADIADEAQAVSFPRIGTSLTADNGDKSVMANESVKLVDVVTWENLAVGGRYACTGTLHIVDEEGNDVGVLEDAKGNPLVSKTLFTADSSSGTASVEFEIDARELGDYSLVAFEVLTSIEGDEGDEELEEGPIVAVHEDAHDEGQTVCVVRKPEEPVPPDEQPPEPEKPTEPETPTKPHIPTKVQRVLSKLPVTGDALAGAALIVPLLAASALLAALAARRAHRRAKQADITIPTGRHARLEQTRASSEAIRIPTCAPRVREARRTSGQPHREHRERPGEHRRR